MVTVAPVAFVQAADSVAAPLSTTHQPSPSCRRHRHRHRWMSHRRWRCHPSRRSTLQQPPLTPVLPIPPADVPEMPFPAPPPPAAALAVSVTLFSVRVPAFLMPAPMASAPAAPLRRPWVKTRPSRRDGAAGADFQHPTIVVLSRPVVTSAVPLLSRSPSIVRFLLIISKLLEVTALNVIVRLLSKVMVSPAVGGRDLVAQRARAVVGAAGDGERGQTVVVGGRGDLAEGDAGFDGAAGDFQLPVAARAGAVAGRGDVGYRSARPAGPTKVAPCMPAPVSQAYSRMSPWVVQRLARCGPAWRASAPRVALLR